ncbi:MAG: RelA/SpoT domain-containing protein [Candidatus Nanoarchaeia archaeon]|nr:RelA/SpoT domain-containing protein [Candidatus Nanoarchaeia archaeon]
MSYSKSQTDKAGDILRKNNLSKEDADKNMEILSAWREKHIYPLTVFNRRLKLFSEKLDKSALIVNRLKRVPSIVNKLNRMTLKLTQMQDIAGCRSIMGNVDLVYSLYKNHYKNGDLRHKLVKVNDYIMNPKKDGYRSLHLVYKYISDKNDKYDGLQIEVQIRSKLQHIWATAVETAGFFKKQQLKSNKGEDKWLHFFKLVSSAFAIEEEMPLIEGVSKNKSELYNEIIQLEKELQVKVRMKQWADTIDYLRHVKDERDVHFFLLELDLIQDKLLVRVFNKRQEKKAIAKLLEIEKKIYDNPNYDTVLIGADTLKNLEQAYPNYFLDTKEFIKKLDKILDYK